MGKPNYEREDYTGMRNFMQDIQLERELAGKPVKEMVDCDNKMQGGRGEVCSQGKQK